MPKAFITLLLAVLFSAQCMPLKVRGSADGFEGQFIRLYAIADFISLSVQKLDVTKVAADGTFELNGHLNRSGMISLRIRDISLDLLVTASQELEVSLQYSENDNRDRLHDRSFKVNILNNSDNGMNARVFAFQKEYAAFLDSSHSMLITKTATPAVQAFSARCREKYGKSSPAFRDYLEYELASLEDAILGSEVKIYRKYIEGKPVQYGNVAYMKFFSQFYSGRFLELSQGADGLKILTCVNSTQDYQQLMKLVAGHDFSANDTLAQLFLILGLKEVFMEKTFTKDKVLSMLGIIQSKALNADNRRIAGNVRTELSFMKKGTASPDFSLGDVNGHIHHLSELAGKPVFIMTWSAVSKSSLRDFLWMKEVFEVYGDRIHMICINMDQDNAAAMAYVRKNNPPYLMLFSDRQYDFADKYRVYTVPANFIINKFGNVSRYLAGRPEEGLEDHIRAALSEN